MLITSSEAKTQPDRKPGDAWLLEIEDTTIVLSARVGISRGETKSSLKIDPLKNEECLCA